MSYTDQLCVPRYDVEEESQPAVGHGRLRGPADGAEKPARQSTAPQALGVERIGSITANGESW